MSGRRYKVLIFDWDEDTLILLQQLFEDFGFDTTITWGEAEARKLIDNKTFDLLLVGYRPPEITAETVLRIFKPNRVSCPCLLLRATSVDSEQGRRLGISRIVPKQDPFRFLEEMQCCSQRQGSHRTTESQRTVNGFMSQRQTA